MPRTKGAKNRTLREITKDSNHAIEKKRLKDEKAALKRELAASKKRERALKKFTSK